MSLVNMSEPVIKLISQKSNIHHSTDTLLEALEEGKIIFGVSREERGEFQLSTFDSVEELAKFNHRRSMRHKSNWYFLALDKEDVGYAMAVNYHYERSIELDEKLFLESALEKLEPANNQETAGAESVADTHARMPIEELKLGVRAYNCLKRSGYNYAEELVVLTEYELLHIRNFGRKCYNELRDALIREGFIDGASEGFVPITKPHTFNQKAVDDDENANALASAIKAVIETADTYSER